jgi:predicted enzyme related to lactoylglutathione lyase
VSNKVSLIVYPVADLAAATKLYTVLLGTEPAFASEQYVSFRVADLEIGLAPAAQAYATGTPIVYVEAADIEAALAALVEAGATKRQGVTDMGWSKIALVADPDGNVIGLRTTPNWGQQG